MNSILKFGHYLLDFLFPKPASLLSLESLSASQILNLLPRAKDFEDDNLIILFDYKDKTVREMIWEIKYKGNRKISRKFIEILIDILRVEIAERALFENFTLPLLVPMPTSTKRRRERGYNQTEILCEEIKKLDIDNLFEYNPKILTKEKHTESQARTHATKREREANLSHSLEVTNRKYIEKRCIVLIDDVTTSGATFREAKRALKDAGARKILCVALAH